MPVKYVGRRDDVYILNFSLPKAAGAILDKHAAPRLRTRGQFIARLLFEFQAREEGREEGRQEERERRREVPAQAEASARAS